MKKTLKGLIAVTASVISTGAMASNMENPLYMPVEGEFYTKTGVGIMYKETDHTKALIAKDADGQVEFPVWRFTEDLGYGITDRLDIHGRFGYTYDGDINRKGMHRGRLGMAFRALTEDDPFIWDLYADAYLSGVTPMKGTYKMTGFDYANYSNGRWGVIAGTKFGKRWADLTLAGHVEYLQTFGNHNNEIKVKIPALVNAPVNFPDEISVDLKSTHEWTAGIDAFYQIDMDWSFGFGFEFVEHADNGVKGVHTKMPNAIAAGQADTLVKKMSNMHDGWDEYILKATLAYQITDDTQVSVFTEYTMDDAHEQSQNGTDVKLELGVRLNAKF